MRFSIQKDLLQKALDVAILAVDKKEQDIRSTFLFDVLPDDKLILWSTDRQQMTKVPTTLVPGTLQGQGQFTVEASRLQKWIKNVQDDVLSVSVEDRTVTMKCGNAKGHFASRDPVEFPDFQGQLESPTRLFSGRPETLVNALRFVAPFIGEGTTNNDIANNMQVTELREREMLATDSISVSLYIVSKGNDDFDPYVELLNAKEPKNPEDLSAEELEEQRDIAEEHRQKHTFKVGSNEIKNLVKFLEKTCASEFVISKKDVFLVESDDGSVFGYNAPIYQLPLIKGIPKALDEPEVWTLDKDRLKAAVNTLTATADPEDVSLTMRIKGEGEAAVLTLSMKDALDRNESTYKLPVFREKAVQDELEFVINWQRLTDPLSLYDNDEIRVGVSAHDGAGAKYLKFYEVTETEDTRVGIVTLRMA